VTAALLTQLEEAGLVVREDSEIRATVPAASVEERAQALAGQFETLRTQDGRRLDAIAEYARAPGCRAAFLRAYFGEETGEPCGLCDLCQERPERPTRFFAPIALPGRAEPKRRGRGRGRRRGGRGRRGGRRRRSRAPRGPGPAAPA
jgi:ATP-dependent DNA helicase RecQ